MDAADRPVIDKVVLMVTDQPASRALACALAERGIVIGGIVIQSRRVEPSSWKQWIHNAIGNEWYQRIVSLRWPTETRRLALTESRLERNAQRILSRFLGDQPQPFPEARMLVTADINSDDTYQWLCDVAPDLMVVYATGLLQPRMIDAARLGALNAHTAVLPDYRGMWAEFWQIYHRAYDRTGITIHYIDEGVDTGDIVYRKYVPVREDTDPFLLRVINTIEIVKDYPAVVEAVLAGRASRSPQGPSSTRCYRGKDLTPAHKRVVFERLQVLYPRSRASYVLHAIARQTDRIYTLAAILWQQMLTRV